MTIAKCLLALSCSYSIPCYYQKIGSTLSPTYSLTLLGRALWLTTAYKVALTLFETYQGRWKNLAEASNYAFDENINLLSNLTLITAVHLSYPYFFIHEKGHFLLAKWLFQESIKFPHRMVIDPFDGGITEYATSLGLTQLGHYFGKERSIQWVTAGGMLASLVFSCFAIVTAVFTKSNLLVLLAVSHTFIETLYQGSYFHHLHPQTNHDLAQLVQKFAIKPIYPLTGLTLIPVTIYSLLRNYPSFNCNS